MLQKLFRSKTTMKIIPAVAIIFLTVTAFSQTSLRSGPKVNGIGLGVTREQVVKRFGKPAFESKKEADECVGGTEMTLRYPGLKFVLWDDPENPKRFTVGQFEVTSARWNVSGAKIGQTSATVRKLFGRPSSQGTENGLPTWYYGMDEKKSPGNTNFSFRKGRLVNITAIWLMC